MLIEQKKSKVVVQPKVSKEVAERMQASFGAWTVLALMLPTKQFLLLQALNRKAYTVTISRV